MDFTLTLHKIGRFLPSAPVILTVWTNIPREKCADVDERWLFDCGVGLESGDATMTAATPRLHPRATKNQFFITTQPSSLAESVRPRGWRSSSR